MNGPARPIGILLLALACALAGAGIQLLTLLARFTIWELPAFVLVLLILGAVLAIPFGVAMLIYKSSRNIGLRVVVGGLAASAAYFSLATALPEHESPQVTRVRTGCQPLIEALVRYEQEHGRAPNALAALVPDYLPALPRITSDRRFTFTNHTASGTSAKVARFPLSGPDELWVECDARDSVLHLRTFEWEATVAARHPFAAMTWRSSPLARVSMWRSLRDSVVDRGITVDSLIHLIGPPILIRDLPPSRWELSYRFTTLFEDEVMAYRPGGDYGDILGTAEARRIKDWAISPYYRPARQRSRLGDEE